MSSYVMTRTKKCQEGHGQKVVKRLSRGCQEGGKMVARLLSKARAPVTVSLMLLGRTLLELCQVDVKRVLRLRRSLYYHTPMIKRVSRLCKVGVKGVPRLAR